MTFLIFATDIDVTKNRLLILAADTKLASIVKEVKC